MPFRRAAPGTVASSVKPRLRQRPRDASFVRNTCQPPTGDGESNLKMPAGSHGLDDALSLLHRWYYAGSSIRGDRWWTRTVTRKAVCGIMHQLRAYLGPQAPRRAASVCAAAPGVAGGAFRHLTDSTATPPAATYASMSTTFWSRVCLPRWTRSSAHSKPKIPRLHRTLPVHWTLLTDRRSSRRVARPPKRQG